jgi:hypothetical protein
LTLLAAAAIIPPLFSEHRARPDVRAGRRCLARDFSALDTSKEVCVVGSWNDFADACRRTLRHKCALAALGLTLARSVAAQDWEPEYVPPPPQPEMGYQMQPGGAYGEFGDYSDGMGMPTVVGQPYMMEAPQPNLYYPSEAAEAGMPAMMPRGDQELPWHGSFREPEISLPPCWGCMSRLGFRHSVTHGRDVGWGWPMRGTSWLNRPLYVGFTVGPMWLTSKPIPGVERDKDVIGAIFFGWDWDYYWGSEILYSYATPELRNTSVEGNPKSDRLVHWDYSFLYYPWGDSTLRPYWRFGIGNTKFDVPFSDGRRRDEWLLSTPWGIGLKYPVRRWLTTRVEFNDQLSWSSGPIDTQHNLTLNFGLEFHFGGHRKSYWPWNPSDEFW